MVVLDDRMVGQVYLRRKAGVLELAQVPESDPNPENEVIVITITHKLS